MNSSQNRNAIGLKLTFNTNKIVNKLYTEISWNGSNRGKVCYLLMRFELENGKTKKNFTNGIEKNKSPDDLIYRLNDLITHVIACDKTINRDNYFKGLNVKTQSEIDKE